MLGVNEAAWFSIFAGVAAKSTLALASAWLFSLLLRKRSAAARHLVWTGAAVAVIALPLLSVTLPVLRLPATGGLLPAFRIVVEASPRAGTHVETPQPKLRAAPAAARESVQWTLDWKAGAIWIWVCGIVVMLARMLFACIVMWRVRRAARPLGVQDGVDVLETARGGTPMTFGLLRPAVFLPAGSEEWSEERRRIVLLHEIAHVRRGDVTTHFLARLALSLYWWNPLAWLAWQEFLKERERATDDLVLAAGVRASEYGSHLLDVARTMRPSASMAVAMARRSELEGRLLAILDTRVNRGAPARRVAWLAALVAVALAAPLAMVRAQENQTAAIPADVDAAIRAATSQRNYEMLEDAAKAAERLRKFDTAHALLDAALAIRGEVSGKQSIVYGLGLMRLGDLEKKRGKAKSAEGFYLNATRILGNLPQSFPALMYLGLEAIPSGQFAQADDYFSRAERADPTRAGIAVTWKAFVEERKQNVAAAELLYQNGLSMDDPKSIDASTTMELYALFLRSQGRGDEATDFETRAGLVRRAATAVQAKAEPAITGVFRIGGGVSAPRVLTKMEPEYSEEARVAKLQGTVVIYTAIGVDGLAHDIKVLRGVGLGLDEKAVEAISQWQFQPGTKDGQPVPVVATIEVNFRLL